MDRTVWRVLWQRYWPVDLLAVVMVLVVVVLGAYLQHRQDIANARAEKQREAVCAVIDRFPAGIDPGIDKARRLDRCGRPHPPKVSPTRSPSPRSTPSAPPKAVTTLPPHAASPAPSPTASPRTTRRPSPEPKPSRSPRPRPPPSPTPTCSLRHLLRCLSL